MRRLLSGSISVFFAVLLIACVLTPTIAQPVTVKVGWIKYSENLGWSIGWPYAIIELQQNGLNPGINITAEVVDIQLATKNDLSQYDILILTGYSHTVSNDVKEKLDFFVRQGGLLWIDNPLGSNLYNLPAGNLTSGVGALVENLYVLNSTDPLLDGSLAYKIDIHVLRDIPHVYTYGFYWANEPPLYKTLVGYITDSNVNPVIMIAKCGAGEIVATSCGILSDIDGAYQWRMNNQQLLGSHYSVAKLAYNVLLKSITPKIPATIDFYPETLNKASQSGKNTITVYIELPIDYDINDVNINTVVLSTANGIVSAQLTPTEVGDYDNDGISDLMVKFDRRAVLAIVDVGDEVEVTVSGRVAGKAFKGSDIVRVTDKY